MSWKERVRKEVDAAIREWNITGEKLHQGDIRALANLIADMMPSPDERNGYVIVPVRPTSEMLEAAKPYMDSYSSNLAWWDAMLKEASAKPPQDR